MFTKKILKISLLSFLFLSFFLLTKNVSYAGLATFYEGDNKTILGKYDGGNYEKGFKFNFFDHINNVEKFIIQPIDETGSIANIPVNASSLYVEGVPMKIDFKYYDSLNNTAYSFSTLTNPDETFFGEDYMIDTNEKIRILPGSNLILNKTISHNDIELKKFALGFLYNGENNLVTMNKYEDKYLLKKDWYKIELHETDYDDFVENLEFNFEIIIPLKVPNYLKKDIAIVNGKQIWINKKRENYNKPVLNQTIALISFASGSDTERNKVSKIITSNNSLYFDPGFIEAIQNEENHIIVEESEDQNTEKIKNKNPIGFSTLGFKLPGQNAYQGISNKEDIIDNVNGLINFVLGFVSSIAVLVLIYGGYLWMVDRGDGTLVEKAKKLITSAVIGILIVISAYTITQTLIEFGDPYDETCDISLDISMHEGVATGVDVECGSPLTNYTISQTLNSLIN